MKFYLMAGSIGALLMAAVGCESTDSSGARANRDREMYVDSVTMAANTSEGDLGPPRPGDDASYQARSPSDWVVLGERNVESRLPPADNIPDLKSVTIDPIDKQFIVEATMSGMYGIESGKVALKKSESAKIRELATKIINDSTSANNELRRMAAERGVVLPLELDQAHRELISRLSESDKSTFDSDFLRAQASANREAISLFETQTSSGKDEIAKQFARSNLPTLQAHLQAAEAPFNTATER